MRARLREWRQALARLARPRDPETLPVRLDRRRIYILPTPFGGFLALLLGAMLLGALNYNNNPALLLAMLLGAAAIASAIMAHLQLSGLRLDALSAEPVAAGTPLRLRLALAADDARQRRGLRVAHAGRHTYLDLHGDGGSEADLDLPTERRGWLDLQRIRISTTQPLGLLRAWAWFWPDTPLLVYPQPESDGPPLPCGDGTPTQTRLHALGEELHQLRPYRAGDAPRAISWKHSARRDTLLVREYERPIGVDVVLDWRTLPALPYERRIARLARWVNEAERDGRRYRLLLPGQPPLGPGRGPQHRHLCLRELALLPHG
ncbi:DUF58 domain-containing protein [Xanthomonas sp. NCPPB 2654]|uniref:DUF58 domain-containing protein n=1 Tax=unclassified Xanthomonas TaxID=2643310 RepID=UPI0021E029CC|nr:MULTISPECIES: DUF58 domain-containing protein [unclassified Xanthomonas]MDL5366468.1 DUF58 domain-containing protein [Xanthomonas sp. NCPPB 2654]UYC21853.1 DUF58 domain-containing protein [Xanthomonas sp. CFBP 8443]